MRPCISSWKRNSEGKKSWRRLRYNVRQNRSGIRIFVVGWMGRRIENHTYLFFLFLFFSFIFLILLNGLHTSSGWVLCRFKNDLVLIFFSYIIFGSLILKTKNSFFYLWLSHSSTHSSSIPWSIVIHSHLSRFNLEVQSQYWRCSTHIITWSSELVHITTIYLSWLNLLSISHARLIFYFISIL